MSLRLLVISLLVPALAFANGSQNSGDSSQNSGNSSQNSGGSSDGSGKSSQDSGEGSKGTGQSSETSAGTSENTADSSEGSQSESSQNSSNEASSQLAMVGSVLVVAGASVYLGWMVAQALTAAPYQMHSGQMAAYLRENHALVARDVLEGQGVVLDGWYASLGLSAEEQALLRGSLDGSDEQAAMLAALDGVDGLEEAQAFATSFVKLLHRTLGTDRTEALVAAAVRRLS